MAASGKGSSLKDEYNSFLNKVEGELRSIVGMDGLKRRLRLFATTSHVNSLRSQYRRVHIKRPVMVFKGNPGTGKTSVAHIVAKIMHMCAHVEDPGLTIVQRESLVADVIGGSALKTQKVLDSAQGQTLLLDEAYRLTCDSKKDFGHESMETIMSSTEGGNETLTNRAAMIFAGYPHDMDCFIRANAGMASRITEEFIFPDYSASEIAEILYLNAEKEGFSFSGVNTTDIANKIKDFGDLSKENARFAHKVLKYLKQSLDLDIGSKLARGDEVLESDLFVLTQEHVKSAFHELGH